MANTELSVERRQTVGKNEARRARAKGRIPAIVYGAKKETVPIFIDSRSLLDAFRAGVGDNEIFLLKMKGTDQARHAMIRELQRDPISRKPLHVDFVRVLMDVKIRVSVPLELVGIARGVRQDAGILDFVTREVEIECLPGDIPAHLPVDVTEVGMGESLRANQIPALEGIQILEDPDRVIVHVAHPQKEEVAVVAAVEEVAAPAEPEVIKKGKGEVEAPEEGKK
jgi:large subunit ribosomal protein L25